MGLGKLSVTVLPATLRVRRNWGSWPGSFGLAQWQVGLPQRRMTAVMEPGRRSPKRRNSSRSLERSDSNFVRAAGMGISSVRIHTLRSIPQRKAEDRNEQKVKCDLTRGKWSKKIGGETGCQDKAHNNLPYYWLA